MSDAMEEIETQQITSPTKPQANGTVPLFSYFYKRVTLKYSSLHKSTLILLIQCILLTYFMLTLEC